jgi:hypothetical protein
MCFIDLEPCKVWEERDRKARKEHECTECRRIIRIGEVYTVHFSVFDGNATTGKLCGDCYKDREEFAAEHDGMRCAPGWIAEMAQKCIGEGDDESDAKWRSLIARIESRSPVKP